MKAQKEHDKEQKPSVLQAKPESGTGGTATITDNRPDSVHQQKLRETMNASVAGKAAPVQQKKNNTGLPDTLKTGIENLSGYAMDDVKVHYNSSKPAQLQAHAYAQGTDIHLAPGQEKQLPHEAWHVVQQKQGRVKPTKQLKSKVNINDDAGLEKEADVMGRKALSQDVNFDSNNDKNTAKAVTNVGSTGAKTIQRHQKWGDDIESIRRNGLIKVSKGINLDKTVEWYTKDEINLAHQGGGAMKSAIRVNGDKVLLVTQYEDDGATAKGDAEDEVEQLLSYEKELAQIPEFYYGEEGEGDNVVREYVFPLYVYAFDHEAFEQDGGLMERIRNVMGEGEPQYNAWGFVQGMMRGVEYGKRDDQKLAFWYRLARLRGHEAKLALTDLQRILGAWKRNKWKDFALFLTDDSRVRIFDPAPRRQWGGLNDKIDPETELNKMIDTLDENIRTDEGPNASVQVTYDGLEEQNPQRGRGLLYWVTRRLRS